MAATVEITLRSFDDVREALRKKDFKQALYDEGGVVTADVLVTLHGDAHRQRRRLEDRLFHRDTVRRYERDLTAAIVTKTLEPFLAARSADLVQLGSQVIMNLTALVAGIDRPAGSPEETEALLEFTKMFSGGAAMLHSTGDHSVVRAEVREALERFDAELLVPSISRRRLLIERHRAGDLPEEELPLDLLTTLLRNEDDLDLPPDVIRREVALYLQAGSHPTINAFTHTMDEVFRWGAAHPEDAERARSGRMFLQRCAHEALRLYPASPVALRTALAGVQLRRGIRVPKGATVTLDLMTANRDRSIFGDDADEFNPHRPVPSGIAPWGHSFGGGMHTCIGMELAGGLDLASTRDDPGEHLFGTVTTLAAAVLAAGARPDPDRPAEGLPAGSIWVCFLPDPGKKQTQNGQELGAL